MSPRVLIIACVPAAALLVALSGNISRFQADSPPTLREAIDMYAAGRNKDAIQLLATSPQLLTEARKQVETLSDDYFNEQRTFTSEEAPRLAEEIIVILDLLTETHRSNIHSSEQNDAEIVEWCLLKGRLLHSLARMEELMGEMTALIAQMENSSNPTVQEGLGPALVWLATSHVDPALQTTLLERAIPLLEMQRGRFLEEHQFGLQILVNNYSRNGQLGDLKRVIEKLTVLAEQPQGNRLLKAIAEFKTADLSYLLGDLAKARRLVERSHQYAVQLKSPEGMLNTGTFLSRIAAKEGNYTEAEGYLRLAGDTVAACSEPRFAVFRDTVDAALARVLLCQGRRREAQVLLEATLKRIRGRLGLSHSDTLRAELDFATAKFADDADLFVAAVNDLARDSEKYFKSIANQRCADLLICANRHEDAFALSSEELRTELERAEFQSAGFTDAELLHFSATAEAARGRLLASLPDSLLEAPSTMQILLDSESIGMRLIRHRSKQEILLTPDESRRLHLEKCELSAHLLGLKTGDGSSLENIDRRIRELDARVVSESPLDVSGTTLHDVLQSLPPHATVLYITRCRFVPDPTLGKDSSFNRNAYFVFAARMENGEVRVKTLVVDQGDVVDDTIESIANPAVLFTGIRGVTRKNPGEADKKEGSANAEELLQPRTEPDFWNRILPLLGDSQLVYVISRESAARIPWNSLYSIVDGQTKWAAEDRTFCVTADLESLQTVLQRRDAELSALLAIGGVDYGKTHPWSPLPASSDECEQLLADWKLQRSNQPVTFLSGRDATQIRVINELPKHNVVHLATHFCDLSEIGSHLAAEAAGFLGRNPFLNPHIVLSSTGDSGLTQSDAAPEMLSASMMMTLNLHSTELVVLSGCASGIGPDTKGEGLLGLQRIFSHCGARRVVGSLWKVDDNATQRLMKEFYENILIRRLSPAAALREAQIKLMNTEADIQKARFLYGGWILEGDFR